MAAAIFCCSHRALTLNKTLCSEFSSRVRGCVSVQGIEHTVCAVQTIRPQLMIDHSFLKSICTSSKRLSLASTFLAEHLCIVCPPLLLLSPHHHLPLLLVAHGRITTARHITGTLPSHTAQHNLRHRRSFTSESRCLHRRKRRRKLSVRKGTCEVKVRDMTQLRENHAQSVRGDSPA